MRYVGWLGLGVAILGITTACDDDNNLVEREDPATECDCPLSWTVDNLAICAGESTASLPPLVYSTWLSDGAPACGRSPGMFPPPAPAAPWSAQRIRSECAGSGTVCFALKQGDAENPRADDCVLAEQCIDFDYTNAEEPLELPPIDGWAVSDQACAYQYEADGGYLEFRVEGSNLGCEVDGEVVRRVQTCPVACAKNPELPECDVCRSDATETLDTRL